MIKYSDTHCMVCGLKFEDNEQSTTCSRCGFQLPALIGDSEEELNAARGYVVKLAENYRAKYWSSAKLYIEVYNHAVDNNGEVRTLGSEDVFLTETGDFKEGEIKWYGEKFARLTGNISMNVSFGRDGEARTGKTVYIENPAISDFWYVGVKYDGDNKYRIVVGNREKYSASEPFECL